ncbi:hypothetical protein [Parvularcula sp. IMCC14364]|uniref:hypothetical protein n=1 Tax=Parvularcula sp. IMCC14364 TaxID=3067902 RepID=UPI0027425194|nr:hypothetical protein [Parvularcula sp. IMCC14364]
MIQQLEEENIVKELLRLRARISERFPTSGLLKVCTDLLRVGETTSRRVRAASRPNLLLRSFVIIVLAGGIAAQIGAARYLEYFDLFQGASTAELTQALESIVNLFILAGAAIWFLLTLEAREKRGFILKHLHELRSFAHVIDMHQLTKDPMAMSSSATRTASSPDRNMSPYELSRYLDYCSEMLALTGKLAACYGERTRDTEVIAAVNDIETMTTGMGRKIWKKIMMIGDEHLQH